MSLQTTLRTSRLTLVPLSDEHFDYEVQLDGDSEVMRYLGTGRPRSRDEVEVLHRRRLAVAGGVPGLGFWAGFVDANFFDTDSTTSASPASSPRP